MGRWLGLVGTWGGVESGAVGDPHLWFRQAHEERRRKKEGGGGGGGGRGRAPSGVSVGQQGPVP